MTGFNQIERGRRTAIYIRISTSQQQTDRQETELKEFALRNGLNFNEKTVCFEHSAGRQFLLRKDSRS